MALDPIPRPALSARPNRPTLHLLTGTTAVGKTDWALRWAEAHDAEIVSCDSLLFYRGADIGTAKPTAAERARVPHHLIDVCTIDEPLDIARYVALAQTAVSDITARGRRVLVTGGSGFYLKAFFAPVVDAVEIPPTIRAQVNGLESTGGLAALVAELERLNPAGLGALDLANPRRVVRALERCLATGRTVGELRAAFAAQPGPFADYTITLTRLDRPRAELDQRIAARVDAMLAAGLVDEVARLRAAGLERNPSAARAIGYREVLAWLDAQRLKVASAGTAGTSALPSALTSTLAPIPAEVAARGLTPAACDHTTLAAEIAQNTRALVKKQATWFRTQLPPHRVLAAGALRTADELFTAD